MSSAAAAAAAMTSPTSTTPGGGRRRERTTTPTYRSEDQALDQIAKEAEERLAARRKAREEARKIRMYELERQQKEAEEQMDKEFEMKTEEKKNLNRHATVPGMTSIPSSTPRRGSSDSAEQESVKDQLVDVQEKYKKAMMTNAQLDNEKATLTFEVDCLKDTLEEQEEVMMELQRETRDKNRELEGKKRENAVIKKDIGTLKEMVSQRDQLISEHGLLVVGDEDEDDLPEGQRSNKRNKVGTIVVVSPEAAELLEVAGDGPLDVRLKNFVEEKKELLEEVRKLRIELEDERSRVATAERRRHVPAHVPAENGPDINEMLDTQREMGRQVAEYKFKLTRTEQEVTTLEGSVQRLEGQVKRYKTAAEQAEAQEEELKAERRRLTRENRRIQENLDEATTENSHLQKRLEKMKSSRLAIK